MEEIQLEHLRVVDGQIVPPITQDEARFVISSLNMISGPDEPLNAVGITRRMIVAGNIRVAHLVNDRRAAEIEPLQAEAS